MAFKDPFGVDNIGRNVSQSGATYIQQAYQLALDQVRETVQAEEARKKTQSEEGAAAAVDALPFGSLVERTAFHAPKPLVQPVIPYYGTPQQGAEGQHQQQQTQQGGAEQNQQDDARYLLKKMELGRRQQQVERMGAGTVKRSLRDKAAEGVTQSMVGWLRSDQ